MIILIPCGGRQHSHSCRSLPSMDIPATLGSVTQFAKATDRMKESTVIQNKWVSICILVFATQTVCTVTNWFWHHVSLFKYWYFFSSFALSAYNPSRRALKATTLSTRWQTMSVKKFIANKWRLMDNKFCLQTCHPTMNCDLSTNKKTTCLTWNLQLNKLPSILYLCLYWTQGHIGDGAPPGDHANNKVSSPTPAAVGKS